MTSTMSTREKEELEYQERLEAIRLQRKREEIDEHNRDKEAISHVAKYILLALLILVVIPTACAWHDSDNSVGRPIQPTVVCK